MINVYQNIFKINSYKLKYFHAKLTKTLIGLILELFAAVWKDKVAVDPRVVELPLHGGRKLRVKHFDYFLLLLPSPL